MLFLAPAMVSQASMMAGQVPAPRNAVVVVRMTRVYVERPAMVYHRAHCTLLSRERVVMTTGMARKEGLVPCGVCRAPQC